MTKRPRSRSASIFLILALDLLFPCAPVFAQANEDATTLLMYFKNEDLLVETPTRSAKPLSRVAENVSIITAREIERMNAHTVAEVLNTVVGIQVFTTSGPGSQATAHVQGSEPRHVMVLIDGVSLNNLSNNQVELGSMPVQIIEKIEIIKGPASSAWGSALGGVVNIITKSGRLADGSNELVSASYGERNTGDFRAETRGRQGNFGYYLNAGRLQTDGLTPHFDVANNNAYAKFTYAITDTTNLGLAMGFLNTARGSEFTNLGFSLDDKFQQQRSTLSLETTVTDNTDLRLSLWSIHQKDDFSFFLISSGNELSSSHFTDQGFGSSIELVYRGRMHHLAFGVDQDSRTLKSNDIAGEVHALRKAAVYLNDTLFLHKLSITPGIRFDYTSSNGNITSPSLGLTYKLTETTIFRAYTAQGFGIPPLSYTFGSGNQFSTPNPDLKMERVLSYQAGAETAGIKYLWVKLSAFSHELRDAISSPFPQAVNESRQRRQGIEAEVRTAPTWNTSLTADASFVSIKDLDTGFSIKDIPTRTYGVGIVYDDEETFSGQLKGRYIDWNSNPVAEGNYGNVIFDLNASNVITSTDTGSLEAFGAVHNIFNDSQYATSLYKNPDRWIEAGLRCKF